MLALDFFFFFKGDGAAVSVSALGATRTLTSVAYDGASLEANAVHMSTRRISLVLTSQKEVRG